MCYMSAHIVGLVHHGDPFYWSRQSSRIGQGYEVFWVNILLPLATNDSLTQQRTFRRA